MISSEASRPERIRPDSRVEPMTPVPRIATILGLRAPRSSVTLSPPSPSELCITPPISALGRKSTQEDHGVGRTLSHPAHEVAVPLRAVRDVDAHLVPAIGDPLLLLRPDAVQHLVLERVRGAVLFVSQCARDLDQAWVMTGHHRVAIAFHQDLQTPDVGLVDLSLIHISEPT